MPQRKDRHGVTIIEPPAEIAHKPWAPCPFELPDAYALQALERGKASADQQQRALQWIVNVACGTYDMEFREGGEEGRRESDFAGGRRFTGLQIIRLLKTNLAIYEEKKA
jgi:hypothetical protein